jgi:hypothetical protein
MYYAFGGTGGVNASGVGGTGGSHYGGAGGGGGGGYLAGGGGSSPLNSGGGAGGGGGSSRGPSGTTFGTAAGGTAASVTITPVRASGTTVTSSLDPSSYGTAVTFTATVASQGGLGPFPTGQVEFKSDGTTVSGCASQTLATVMPSPGSFQQQATCTTSALAPSGSSPHEITASYGGDDGYLASTGTLSGGQSVIQSSQTSVSSSPNPSISGHAVTFTATVAPQSSGTPHGQVEFRADGTTISGCASQTLATVSGEQQATCTTSALGLSGSSPHAITALYAGEAGYFRSSTGTLTDGQSVIQSSDTTVGSSQNPSSYAQAVTFTATVAPQSSGTPQGQVAFQADGTTIAGCGSQPLANVGGVQQASCTTSALGPSGASPHAITAQYAGEADSFDSSTGTLTGGQSVDRASSQTSMSSSDAAPAYGKPVTFTATVAPQSSGTPQGQVEFQADGTTISGCASQALAGVSGQQQATCTTSTLGPSGSSPHVITALYPGDANFTSSQGTLAGGQAVDKAPSQTSVSSSSDPSDDGQPVTFTATVAPQSSGTPQGQVEFQADGTTISGCASQALASVSGEQQATCTTSALAPSGSSPHAITALYAGDGNFTSSQGTLAGGHSVNQPAPVPPGPDQPPPTVPPPSSPPGQPGPAPGPLQLRATLTSRSFVTSKGTTLTLVTNASAKVKALLTRTAPGRLAKRRCVAPSRAPKGKRCTRTLSTKTLKVTAHSGRTKLAFGKGLTRGNWIATLTAPGAHSVTLRFQVR